MTDYIQFLQSLDMPPNLRALLALLSDMSCSPWKFDAIWDIWPRLGLSQSAFPALASRLLEVKTAERALYG